METNGEALISGDANGHSTGEAKEQFDRDGFLCVPGVLSPRQTGSLRETLIDLFSRDSAYEGDVNRNAKIGSIRFDICNRYPQLRWLPFHPPLLAALRSVLGEPIVLLPEMAAHDSGFGDWHKDTTSQERAGLKFHWEPDYLMVEAAFYLQDNDPVFGGGLDVIPGSHRTPDRYRHNIGETVFHKGRDKLKKMGLWPKQRDGHLIPSKAGDLVIFHFRTDHKATSVKQRPIPAQHRKLALFFAFSADNRHVRVYRDYIASRPDYLYLKNPVVVPEMEAAARESGVILA
jgi:hypothetical protein